MADKYWLGIATEVAQIDTVQITGYDGATTYKLTVGGFVISVVGDTDVDGTAAALAAAWNASTHPYCTGITASVATDTVTLTADNAGVPNTIASSVSGGSGTIGSVANTTASVGPCDWSSADNWSDGAIPANGDTVIFENNSVNCSFGLSNSAVLLVGLQIEQSYTGKIGLDRTQFCTSADGETLDATKQEYREDFLDINADAIEIGKQLGTGTSAGSGRIKIDNASVDTAKIEIFTTAAVGAETNLPPVRLKTSHANTDIFLRGGKVGLGIDEAGEVCTVGEVHVNGTATLLLCGTGCAITDFYQGGGKATLHSTATMASVTLTAGKLTIEGDFTITLLDIYGGTLIPNHIKSAGNAITTLNLRGGNIDATKTSVPRTWATLNPYKGSSLKYDPGQIVVSTFNEESVPVNMTYA